MQSQQSTDKGLTGSKPWYDITYDPKGLAYHSIFPGYWEDQGIKDLNGVVWYRKTN
jgi:sialate O-acetylesterase